MNDLKLQDKICLEKALIIGDNLDKTGEQPVYIAIENMEDDFAVGLTETQVEDMVAQLMDILIKYKKGE